MLGLVVIILLVSFLWSVIEFAIKVEHDEESGPEFLFMMILLMLLIMMFSAYASGIR